MNSPICIALPTPFGIGPINTYLFAGSEPTLVDCGVDTDESWNALVEALAKHNLAVADLRKIVVTHAHIDHMGMAARIVENSDANVYIWEQIAPWAYETQRMWRNRMQFLHATLHQYDLPDRMRDGVLDGMAQSIEMWGTVPKERVSTFSLSDKIPIGPWVWDVVYAPGHSATQTTFFQTATGQLLAADMLLPLTPTPVLEAPLTGGLERHPCMAQMLDSYARFYNMAITNVYPGHGEPFVDHMELITKQRTRITTRKNEALKLIRDGHHQVGEIVDIMYAHHPENSRFSGLSALIGYLDLLLEDNLIQEKRVGGVRRYTAVDRR